MRISDWSSDVCSSDLPPLLLLITWQYGTSSGSVDTRFFPAPSTIADEGWELLSSGALVDDVMATLRMVGIGFAFGSVLGIVVGLVMGTLPVAGAMLRDRKSTRLNSSH